MNERELHKQVASYLERVLSDDVVFFAVPNGELRTAKTGALLKAMGVKAGVPDLAFVLPDGIAAFIELKAEGGRLSDSQKAFRDRLPGGACHVVCRSLEDVEQTLIEWGLPLRFRLKVAA